MIPLNYFKRYFLLLLFCLSLSACQSEKQPLIKIGAHQITLDSFQQEIQPLKNELAQLPPEQQKLLLRQALSQLIDQELLLGEAQRRGILVTEQEILLGVEELRGNYSHEEYMEILRNSGQDTKRWMQQLRIKLLSKKVAADVTKNKNPIENRRIEEYYLTHLDEYRHPEQLQARQILLATEDEALKLRTRILAGEPFDKLAREHSISPDRENGGDLGLFARGQLPAEFDEALFKLTPGRVSQPIKSPYGTHLFLVDQRDKAGVQPLTDVSEEILQKLQTEEEAELYLQWLQGLRDKSDVQIDWEQLDKLHFNKAE